MYLAVLLHFSSFVVVVMCTPIVNTTWKLSTLDPIHNMCVSEINYENVTKSFVV